jgi:tRNA pseudouridine55 synthase
MEVLQAELPLVTLRIRCSKGTYIRALVRDLGRALKTGACMTSLRRTAIGPFEVAEAISMEGVDQLISTMN